VEVIVIRATQDCVSLNAFKTDFRQPWQSETIDSGILAARPAWFNKEWRGTSGKKFAHAAGDFPSLFYRLVRSFHGHKWNQRDTAV
jgi:hypothetical protein